MKYMDDCSASKSPERKTTDLTDNIFKQPLLEVSNFLLNYMASRKNYKKLL